MDKDKLELVRKCVDSYAKEYGSLEIAVRSDGVLVQLNGVGVTFTDDGPALAVRYHSIGRLAYWSDDIADQINVPRLIENEYTCEHGTVPVDAVDLGNEPIRAF